MIRFFADIIYLFFFLTLTAPLYPLFDHWNKTGKAHKRSSIAQRMILRSFKICLAMAGTKLIVDGQENIPEDGAVLYVGNHSSYYDILCSYVATERGMGFFAKKEMEKIPCLSHWMRFINCLFLDRKNIKAGLATMNEGTKLLKDGFSIAIFPEGTRSQDEDPHEFKEGSLRPALKAGVPVIPMAISGTSDILENNRRFQVKPTTVHITFGQPIYPDQLERAEKKHLGATIREEIIEMRKKYILGGEDNMSVWTVILIIAVIAAIILGVLYFVGRKMQAKQEDQRAQLDQMAQTVNMLVIDKKRMKIMEAGFPKMVTDNIPKRAKMSKVPVVKAKIGPKITPLLCDEAIFDDVPVKAEIKAVVSGIYITSIKNLRNVAPPEPEKRGLRAKLTKKSAEFMRKN